MVALLVLILTFADPGRSIETADCWRFPYSNTQVKAGASFAEAHAEWACGPWQMKQTPWGPLVRRRVGGAVLDPTWREEAMYADACWEALAESRASVGDQLDALGRLRALLGEADFYAGRMPLPAPIRYFRER